jgi:hypothetical protein
VDNLNHPDDILAGYLSEREMASQLRRNERTLQRWRKQQIGPPFTMIGEAPFYSVEAGRQWLAAGGTAVIRRRA